MWLALLSLLPSLPSSPLLTRRVVAGALCWLTPLASHATDASLSPAKGLFPDCPVQDVCVSSQDDRPQAWDNPWDTDGEEPSKAIGRQGLHLCTRLSCPNRIERGGAINGELSFAAL